MFKPLSLYIAHRFSKSRSRNKLVSFISLSSVIGIAVGVMVIIVGLSAMNGFERELQNRVLSVVPHGELEGVRGPVENWRQLVKEAERNPDVTGAAPYVRFTALLEKGTKLKSALVRGIDPSVESKLGGLERFVGKAAWQKLVPGERALIIGKGIADRLGVKEGDWLTAMIPQPENEKGLAAPTRERLHVVGILSLGGQIDHTLALVPIGDAQSYLGMGDTVTGVELKMDDPMDSRRVVREVGATVDAYVYLKDWTLQFGYLHRDIQMVRTIMYLVMVLVIGVACFNVVSTLMMSVKDRASDIAILRTMGANDSMVRGIFVWHGLLTGFFGSVAGAVLGALGALYLTPIIKSIENLTGHQFLSGDIYFVNFLPSQLVWTDVVLVMVTAWLLSLIATLYPAMRASKLHPASVLSGR